MKQIYKLISFKHIIYMAIYPKLSSVWSEAYFLGLFVLIHAVLAAFFSSQNVIKILEGFSCSEDPSICLSKHLLPVTFPICCE